MDQRTTKSFHPTYASYDLLIRWGSQMNEKVGCGKEGNWLGMENWRSSESGEIIPWYFHPVDMSLEKEGKI